MAELTVSAGLARGLAEFAAARGASLAALAEQARIPVAALADLDARIPLSSYVALVRAAKMLTGDSALPLHYGGSVDMAEFSVVGMLFKTCETVLEALTQINRYGRLVVEVETGEEQRFRMVRRDGALWLSDTRRDPNDFPELTEATFARFVCMTRPLVGDIVQEVHVTHAAPRHQEEYAAYFRTPILFEAQWNAVRLDEERLTRPIRQEPRYVFGIFSERAEKLLTSLDRAGSMQDRVERLLLRRLHAGDVGVEAVARALGQSRQTLYRKLKMEGVSYEQVLDGLRRRLAFDCLRDRKLSVNETAYLLGFSDAASFSHAFKRWTGVSPRAWRRSLEVDGDRRKPR